MERTTRTLRKKLQDPTGKRAAARRQRGLLPTCMHSTGHRLLILLVLSFLILLILVSIDQKMMRMMMTRQAKMMQNKAKQSFLQVRV